MAKPKKKTKKKTRSARKRTTTPPPGKSGGFAFNSDSAANPQQSNLNQIAPKLTYKICGTPVLPLSRPKN
jgi:hypothetical protein